jgi:hypothetical protein
LKIWHACKEISPQVLAGLPKAKTHLVEIVGDEVILLIWNLKK